MLKGGPIHKPYWLPWAPLPHLFFKFYMYILCVFLQNDNRKPLKKTINVVINTSPLLFNVIKCV